MGNPVDSVRPFTSSLTGFDTGGCFKVRQLSEFATSAIHIVLTERRFRHQRALKSKIARVFVRHHLRKCQIMRSNRIEFISECCDRWCERCTFTSRCSSYAVKAAIGMCGDFKEAIELAVGAPRKVRATGADDEERRPWLDIPEPTAKELREVEKAEKARQRRIDDSPVTKLAERMTTTAYQWFHASSDAVRASGDAVVIEALEIVEWDSHFIAAKLYRALSGQDRHQTDEAFDDDDPIQNDWNGSAKVALISIDRSEVAWQVIGQATGDVAAADLATALAGLRSEVEKAFPRARRFTRPGFDGVDT